MTNIFDTPLKIAYCRNRTDTSYVNVEKTWADFASELSIPKRTEESLAEYLHMNKAKQGEAKDGPGFVGGYLRGGKRSKETVESRSMVTLDIDDEATPALVEELENGLEERNLTAVIYGTHKYTINVPRCRLVIPLSREVEPRQYEFIARQIADDLVGIDTFDPTTFQPSRMMYLPSCSRDADFFYYKTDGAEPLNVDYYLGKFDWGDEESWPRTRQEREQPAEIGNTNRTGLLGDPAAKGGVIGAFCTVYSPDRAIQTFLSDVYEPSGTPGRYNFKRGSSPLGLRIYDDTKTVKCEDATDPANVGTSINAFDLVRIHKFGYLDRGVATADISDRPSQLRMINFAQQLPEVKALLEAEEISPLLIFADEDIPKKKEKAGKAAQSAKKATDGPKAEKTEKNTPIRKKPPVKRKNEPAPVPEETDWIDTLEYEQHGKYSEVAQSADNLRKIFENDPHLKGLVGINEFKGGTKELLREPPWTHSWNTVGPSWSDEDDANLRIYMESNYRIDKSNKILDALAAESVRHPVHPVKKYIESAEWDEIERVDTLFIDVLGAEDTPYTREITRKWLTAAVARVYDPGCKWDYVPVLIGPQGIGKSLLVRKLGGQWTQDSLPDLKSEKNAYEALSGYWLVEIGELASMKKSDRESVKNFISKTTDDYRKAYGHNVGSYRRTCVFIGTTNESEFLDDSTGNRRFFPIRCSGRGKTRSWELTDDDVHQIWAEAYRIWRAEGGELMEFSKDVADEAIRRQKDASVTDEWTQMIEEFLNTPIPADFYKRPRNERQAYFILDSGNREFPSDYVLRRKVCISEVWVECFGRNLKDITRTDSLRLARCLKAVKGFEPGTRAERIDGYGVQKVYVRTEN